MLDHQTPFFIALLNIKIKTGKQLRTIYHHKIKTDPVFLLHFVAIGSKYPFMGRIYFYSEILSYLQNTCISCVWYIFYVPYYYFQSFSLCFILLLFLQLELSMYGSAISHVFIIVHLLNTFLALKHSWQQTLK